MTDHELDTLLSDLNDDVPPMSEAAFQSGRARLSEIVGAAPAATVTRLPTLPPEQRATRRSPPRRLAVLAVAAAAVVAAGTGVYLVGGGGSVTPAAVDSPDTLAAWARGLADDPEIVGPGQYRYVRSELRYERDLNNDPRFRVVSTLGTEQWIPHDYRDEQRLRTTPERYEFTRGTEEAARAAGLSPLAFSVSFPTARCLPPGPVELGTGELDNDAVFVAKLCDGDGWADGATTPEFYREWADPAKLYDELVRQADGRGAGLGPEIFVQAETLLEGNLPSEFKAALYEALSRAPGLVVQDNATTSDGRTGIGLRVSANGTTKLWILDRETGDPLEQQETAGQAVSTNTLTYGVTDDLRTTPPR